MLHLNDYTAFLHFPISHFLLKLFQNTFDFYRGHSKHRQWFFAFPIFALNKKKIKNKKSELL